MLAVLLSGCATARDHPHLTFDFELASVVWTLLGASTATYVATRKVRSPVEGFVLGLLLGPLGTLIVANLPQGASWHEPGVAVGSRPQCAYQRTTAFACGAPATYGVFVNASLAPLYGYCDAHVALEAAHLRKIHPDWQVQVAALQPYAGLPAYPAADREVDPAPNAVRAMLLALLLAALLWLPLLVLIKTLA